MISMSSPGKRALALVASIPLSRLCVRSGMGLRLQATYPSRRVPAPTGLMTMARTSHYSRDDLERNADRKTDLEIHVPELTRSCHQSSGGSGAARPRSTGTDRG